MPIKWKRLPRTARGSVFAEIENPQRDRLNLGVLPTEEAVGWLPTANITVMRYVSSEPLPHKEEAKEEAVSMALQEIDDIIASLTDLAVQLVSR